MLKLSTLLNGIKTTIEEAYPGERVYVHTRPAEEARPSFLVACGLVKTNEAGGGQNEFTIQVNISCFVDPGEAHRESMEELTERMCGVMGLFERGCIQAGERHPHVISLEGSCQADFAEVKATLQVNEPWQERTVYPLIGSVNTIIKGGSENGIT